MDDIILDEVILKGEATNPGPEMDTVYIPGTSGAAWTKEEVKYTRLNFFVIFMFWYKRLTSKINKKSTDNNYLHLKRLTFYQLVIIRFCKNFGKIKGYGEDGLEKARIKFRW